MRLNKMDIKKIKQDMVAWVKDYFKKTIPGASAVVGISGGKDSSITSSILKEALGRDKVVAVMMPDGVQSDIEDSKELAKAVDLKNITVNIGPVTEAFIKAVNEGLKEQGLEMSKDARINMPPRIRMAVLYAVAQSLEGGGLVANTCNLSEDYVGYATKFGDAAGDFSLFANLTVEDVLKLGDECSDVPQHLVHKTPSDGLSGMSDEDKIGFKYAELDKYIKTGEAPAELKEKIERMHKANLHKLEPMPKFEPQK